MTDIMDGLIGFPLEFFCDIPGQQVSDLMNLMVCDMGQDIAQIRLRINAIELGADDQGKVDPSVKTKILAV